MSEPLKRPNFFNGRFLTAADLNQEQEYVRDKFKRHNRTLHGFGIASGLRVTIDSGQIVVEPGLALDCEGNEIVIETAQTIAPPATPASPDDGQTAYLNVRFVEQSVDPVPTIEGEEDARTLSLVESFEFAVAPENFNRCHRHLRALWLACGKLHALTIAKLRKRSTGWRVDRGYRAPAVK